MFWNILFVISGILLALTLFNLFFSKPKKKTKNIESSVMTITEQSFIDAAVQRTNKEARMIDSDDAPVAAMSLFDALISESISQGIQADKNELKLTAEARKKLNLEFKNKSLEPFSKYVTTLNRDGQLGMTLDALDFLTENFEPIIQPNGGIRVVDMRSMEDSVFCSVMTGTPMYIFNRTTGEMETLSEEMVSRLVVEPNLVQTIATIEELEKAVEELQIQVDLKQETILVRDEHIKNLSNEVKQLKMEKKPPEKKVLKNGRYHPEDSAKVVSKQEANIKEEVKNTARMSGGAVFLKINESIQKTSEKNLFNDMGVVFWGRPGQRTLVICESTRFQAACERWAHEEGIHPFISKTVPEKLFFKGSHATLWLEAYRFKINIGNAPKCRTLQPRDLKFYVNKIDNGAFDTEEKQMQEYQIIVDDIKKEKVVVLDNDNFSEILSEELF